MGACRGGDEENGKTTTKNFLLKIRFWEALGEIFVSNIVIILEKHLKLCGKQLGMLICFSKFTFKHTFLGGH